MTTQGGLLLEVEYLNMALLALCKHIHIRAIPLTIGAMG